MDIRTLRYFVEVVRQQSFTRAAEKLFVTQPTISKMLKNLEDELNCTLLIRDGRRLLLTDTGRVVFERGQAILGEFHQLESELSDINHLHKGILRLGIPPMVGMLMAEPIGLFRQRYPGVELKIAEFGGLTVQQAVSNGELDLAMTAGRRRQRPEHAAALQPSALRADAENRGVGKRSVTLAGSPRRPSPGHL